MEYIQQLIKKFWKGEASEPERRELDTYLQHHREEFEEFLRQTANDPEDLAILNLLDEAKADKLLENIQHRAGITDPGSKQRRRPYWPAVRFAAAAVLLVVSGVAIFLQQPNKIPVHTNKLASSAGTGRIIQTNTGNTEMLLTLPDQSLVRLAPQSSISYAAYFGLEQRDISLKGKARFRVMNNAAKPFTVYANGYATTALGTEFIVSTRMAGKTRVKLLSGKVVVRSTAGFLFPQTEKYLVPGEELLIDMLGRLDLLNEKQGQQAEETTAPATQMNESKAPIFLHFDETPLTTVLAQVGNALHADIVYADADIADLSFTGRLSVTGGMNETDSLDVVLSSLCQKNGLVYTYKNNQIIISKKK